MPMLLPGFSTHVLPLVPALMPPAQAQRMGALEELLRAVSTDDVPAARAVLAQGYPGGPQDDGVDSGDGGSPDPNLPQHQIAVRMREILSTRESVMHLAVQQAHPGMVALLLDHGLGHDQPFLYIEDAHRLRLLQRLGWALPPDSLAFRLGEAAYALRIDQVDLWCDQGADPCALTPNGSGAMGLAVHWHGDRHDAGPALALVDHLLNLGVPVDQRDAQRSTPLLTALAGMDERCPGNDVVRDAADRRQMRLVHGLLDRGADATVVGPDGGALFLAVRTQAWDHGVTQALRTRGAVLDLPPATVMVPHPEEAYPSALGSAVRIGHAGLIAMCLAEGGDRNAPVMGQRFWPTGGGLPPLLLAASQGDLATIDQLLDAGADLAAALDHPFWASTRAFWHTRQQGLGGATPPDPADAERQAAPQRARVHMERRALTGSLGEDEPGGDHAARAKAVPEEAVPEEALGGYRPERRRL